jgi:hypothetical protein
VFGPMRAGSLGTWTGGATHARVSPVIVVGSGDPSGGRTRDAASRGAHTGFAEGGP